MFENLGFLKSKFLYLTIDKYRKDGCLKIYRRISKTRMFENLSSFLIQASVFDYRQISTRRMFVLKSQTASESEYRKMFENFGFFVIQVFIFDYR